MSLLQAVDRAYKLLKERDWSKIYWAIDLHGVCLKSNYIPNKYEWINHDAVQTLQLINKLPESEIIIWTSCYPHEYQAISEFFGEIGVNCYINCNPEIENIETGCFDEKFYFSILLDDKAGFDPETDWSQIFVYLKNKI